MKTSNAFGSSNSNTKDTKGTIEQFEASASVPEGRIVKTTPESRRKLKEEILAKATKTGALGNITEEEREKTLQVFEEVFDKIGFPTCYFEPMITFDNPIIKENPEQAEKILKGIPEGYREFCRFHTYMRGWTEYMLQVGAKACKRAYKRDNNEHTGAVIKGLTFGSSNMDFGFIDKGMIGMRLSPLNSSMLSRNRTKTE